MPDTSHSPFGSRNPHYENPFSEPKKMHHKAAAHVAARIGGVWSARGGAGGLRSVGPSTEQ